MMLIESFFLRVFSFSIFAIVVISLYQRIGDIWLFLFISIMGIALDTVLHMPIGLHMIVLGTLLLALDMSWTVISRNSNSGYFLLFLFVVSYYLLIPIINSIVQDNIFPEISPSVLLWTVVKGIVSVGICILIDRLFTSLRDSSEGTSIRLR